MKEGFIGFRGGEEYLIMDDRSVLEFFFVHRDDSAEAITYAVLSNTEFWGEDLTEYEGLWSVVAKELELVEEKGAYELMRQCLSAA